MAQLKGSATLAAVAAGLLAAWLYRPTEEAAALPSGVEIRLPPIPLTGVSDPQSLLNQLQPTITPHLFPPSWTVSWPVVEIPTDYGPVQVQPPSMELPFIPRGEVEQLVSTLRPQLVQTENGLAIQVSAVIPT